MANAEISDYRKNWFYKELNFNHIKGIPSKEQKSKAFQHRVLFFRVKSIPSRACMWLPLTPVCLPLIRTGCKQWTPLLGPFLFPLANSPHMEQDFLLSLSALHNCLTDCFYEYIWVYGFPINIHNECTTGLLPFRIQNPGCMSGYIYHLACSFSPHEMISLL